MPQDFDPDAWMAKQKKGATKPESSAGADFDPDAFMAKEAESRRPRKPSTVLPTERQEFRRPINPLNPATTSSPRAVEPEGMPALTSGPLYEAMQDQARRQRASRQEAFEKKPFTEQWTQRIEDAIERGGRQAGGMALKAAGAGLGAVGMLQGKPFEVVDLKPERFKKPDAAAEERLASRRQLYRPSFAGDVVEGIAEGAPQAAGALILGGLTGGGALAAGGIGAGMGAAGADWKDPKRAAVQTALGAVAPLAGGVAGSKLGSAVASRLVRPVAQGLSRAGGEVLGGAAGNVIGSGAEQLGFEGKLDPRELAKQAIFGGALNVPGAIGAAKRRPALTPESPIATQPVVAPVAPRVQPPDQFGFMKAFSVGQGIGDNLKNALRASVAKNGKLPSQERNSAIGKAYESAVAGGAPRDVTTLDAVMLAVEGRQSAAVASPPRTQQPPEVTRTTAEIAKVPTAPTGRIPTQPPPAPAQPQPAPKPQGRVVRVGDKDYTLTPEQEARWKTEVDEPLAQAAQRAKDFEAFGHGRQEAAKTRKGVAMRVSAKKREILGAFTPREEAARAARQATNYKGKAVSVEGVNGTVEGMSFGRVRVKLEDGRQVNVERGQIAQPVPSPRTPEGAIIAQPSSLPSRKLLPPGTPDAPATAWIQYPDAPATQEMPEIRARIAAEEAPTKELTRPPDQPQTVADVRESVPASQAAIERQPAEAEIRAQTPAYGRVEGVPEGAAGNRSTSSQRSPVRAPEGLESPRQPKVTDENIAALRAEQEQLGRLAYDRRGDFTGDLRDRYNELNSIIREYDNARSPRELAPPPARGPERMVPPEGERAARREALQPKTGPMPETLTPGRKVTQEMQIPPALKPTEAFSSREDARQGHFERFNDEELVSEIARLEDVRNQGLRGRGKMTRQEIEANNFDLRVAVEMQKERRRLQQQIGIEPGERIAPRTPGRPARKIQHSTLGEVVEAADQKGVPPGKLRVVDETTGKLSVIQNPRTKGNRSAAFVKGPAAEAAAPMQAKLPDLVQGMKRIAHSPSSPVEISQLRAKFPDLDKASFDAEMTRLNEQGRIALHRHDHPSSLTQSQRDSMVKIGNDYFTAATFREGGGQIMGMGLGGLQGMFKGKGKTPEPGQQALFESAPKPSLAKRAASNAVSAATLPRALMASADLSAPLRQGAILTLPPTQWGRAAKSGIRMLQALRTSQYKRLADEMNSHPDAKVGKEAGLYMATDPKEGASLRGREEDFISKWAEKIPIVKHSEQAYKTYLDSIRLETFKKYKRVIDKDKKLSLEEKGEAYKAAADWINVASGRGSLGKTLDKAMPALSTVFFAPRYAASRVEVLNPLTYAKNSTTAAGRAVLKQQMSDLVQFAGMTAATLALAKAAGAEVGLDPEDSDFLKIKIGNTRYDTLAGLQQFMRLFYRVGKDVGLAAQDKKAEGETAAGVLAKFGHSKLAPIPSFFTDMVTRKDFTGRKFEMERGIKERVLPLMWKDFYEAYQREGFGGAAKLTPGFFGVGTADFEKRPGNLSVSGKIEAELKKHGLDYSSVSQIPGDTEETQRARGNKVEAWLGEYGGRLIDHPRYKLLSASQQKAALENLRRRIGSEANQKRPDLRNFRPTEVFRSVRESERQQPRRDRGKLVVAPD